MSDEFSPLDLKFLPDWLKESPSPQKYAQYSGESTDRPRRDDGARGGARGPGGGRDARRGPRSDRPGDRPREGGDRGRGRDGGPGRSFDNRRGSGPGQGDRPRGAGYPPRQRDGHDPRDARFSGGEKQAPPPAFKLEFLPEPTAAAHISKQIRQSARAYPLFGTARMFLEKPERHQVRVISTEPGRLLFQLEEGPICFDRTLIERSAFRLLKERFYREESREIEGPKGNYTSVARCRSTGTLLGPTSHHAYQVAIRKLYEERFSRRMSFVQFQREEIEILANEQAVADWKNQLSKVTVYFTTAESEPQEFKTLAEVESHFHKTYLPNLIRSGNNLVCSGRAAREFPERFLANAAREAFDRELAYPGAIVHGLRHQFADQNLHVFKHRKRVLYVSAIRPKPATTSYEFAEGPATLLTVIGEHPRISKRDLAARILGIVQPPPGKSSGRKDRKRPGDPGLRERGASNVQPAAPESAPEISESTSPASEILPALGSLESHEAHASPETLSPVTALESADAPESNAAVSHQGAESLQQPEYTSQADSESAAADAPPAEVPSQTEASAEAESRPPQVDIPEAPVEEAANPELESRKTQLAADLHYLVHTGHVIEFADGRLDLPLVPVQPTGKSSASAQASGEAETAEQESDESEEDAATSEIDTSDGTPVSHGHADSPEDDSEPAPSEDPAGAPMPTPENATSGLGEASGETSAAEEALPPGGSTVPA